MTGECSISDKVKGYLERKLNESKVKIKKLKQKRKVNNVLIIVTGCYSNSVCYGHASNSHYSTFNWKYDLNWH